MDNSRNMILAFVLSALVLFGWSALSDRYFPAPKPVVGAKVDGTRMPDPANVPVANAAKGLADVATVRAQSPRIAINTPLLSGSINLKGARIDDLVMNAYKETIKKDSPAVRLFAPSGAKEAYFSGFGWSGDGLSAPGPDTLWTSNGQTLTIKNPVILSWANATGQNFEIKISVDKEYMFHIDQTVSNTAATSVGVRPYAFVSRLGKSKDPSTWQNHVGPIGAFNGAVNYKINWDDVDEAGAAGTRFASQDGWIGFGDHYWLTALIPSAGATIDAGFRAEGGNYQAEFTNPQTLIQPGKGSTTSTRLFAGAKEVRLLDGYETTQNIVHFGKAIDWGWFELIAKPFFYLLDWLFSRVGNFGVAIMMLTLIVRGAMFPVAQRQFASMAAMRVVQPKLKALQERYKDDKPKLQQEMMAFYKTEKINPVAGCLPVLLQIPVFYGLYKVLTVTIEMRHQPFFAWIKDLSAPDPANIVNLFAHWSIPLPHIFGIGILAVLFGVTMYLQFKLNPAPVDPVQQQMFSIMPWVAMVMMATFASGLLLYWTTSNILAIAQQKWLYSRHPALKEPVKA